MLKKLLILVLSITICAGGTISIFAAEGKAIDILVNGKNIGISAITREGELYLPMRAISEELGFEMQWLESKRIITMNTSETSMSINLSENKVTYNGHEAYISGGYRILNGRTYLSKGFYSDVLRLKLAWDKPGNKVTLESVEENSIVINTVKKSSKTDTLLVNARYPELKGLENAEVENRLNCAFAKLAEEAINRGAIIEKDILPEQTANGIKAEIYYDYKVKYNQKGFISIVFLDYLYSGGAHGLTVQSSYTFDLKTGKEYKLKDLFKNDTDYVSMISSEVKKQMEEREMTGYLPPFEAIRADQDFYLSNNELVVYFQAYEYAPYAAGIPEFDIGFPLIKKLLNPDFEFLNAVPVKFEKANKEQKIKMEDNMQIGAVLLNENVDGGRAYIYEKVDDNENLHGGFAVGESFYDLGAVGSIRGFLNEITFVRALELYGKTVIKYQGVFGSHVSNTSYFIIDRGIPVPFLSTEGIATEMDIDGDGIKEIVAEMPGTIPSVNIFEWNGDSFLTASVDVALGAGSVIFNKEDGSFSACYRRPGSEDTLVTDYYYAFGGMKLKKDLKDVGDILSENTIDYNKDSIYEKVIVKMTGGKQYEETEAGPFQGWNWQGKFILQLIDDKGNAISELDLNKAFEGEELIFNRVFLLQFDDYNNDGNTDFTVGQYGSSNGNVYRLFTLIDNKIEMLPVQTGSIFNSGGNGRYAISLEKVSEIGFLNAYYDNSKGKIVKQYFIWDGSQFVLQSPSEE